MRSLRPMFAFLNVTLILCLVSTPALLSQSKDERAILALIEKFKQAANSTNPTLVKRLLGEISPPGVPFYTPFRDVVRTGAALAAEIETSLQTLSSRRFSITTQFSIQRDGKIAWTSYDWRTETVHRDGSQQSLEGRDTLIFDKQGKDWKLRHLHSSLPAKVPPTRASSQVDAKAILDQETAMWNALRDQQIDTLATSLDKNYSALQDGQAYRIQGKNTYLSIAEDWIAQNELRSFQLLDPKLEILGDTALLTYYYISSGLSHNEPFSHSGKASSVYVRKEGKWLALHHHNTLNASDPIPREKQVD